MKYIDVSQWQGVIDWETVKGNIDGAILRAGYGQNNIDPQFDRNAAECNRLGIPCGAYWFSYAWTPETAKREAEYLLAAVKPYRMELPLCFDFEYDSVTSAAKRGVTVTRSLATQMVYAFCETVEAGGYWCLNYANPDFLTRFFTPDVPQRFGLWLAQWPGGTPDVTKPPRPDAQIWQWGGSIIPGITARDKDGNIATVDTNEAYRDFAAVIRAAGLNHLPKVYEEDDGSAIYEYSQQPIPKPTPLLWAKNCGLCGDVTADSPVTWGELSAALYKLHGPDDDKTASGLLTD